MSERQECSLCGLEGHDDVVRVALVHWIDPPVDKAFDAVPRCRDREACRNRVEARGEAWPLVEGGAPRPAPPPPAREEPEPPPIEIAVPAVAAIEATTEEAAPIWPVPGDVVDEPEEEEPWL